MSSRETSARPSDFRGTALRLLRQVQCDRARIAAVLALAVVGMGMLIVTPTLLGRITDAIVAGIRHGGVDFSLATRLLVLVVLLAVLSWLCNVIQARLIARIVQRMAFRMRELTERTLPRLPLEYFDTRPRGEILSRVTNDIDNVAQSAQQMANRLLSSLFLLLGSVVMMLRISVLLTVIAVVTVPLSIWTTKVIGRTSRSQFERQWAATGALSGYLEDIYSGHDLVTVFDRWPMARCAFNARNEELRRVGAAAQFRSGVIGPMTTFLGNIDYVLIAVIGGLRIASGLLTVGEIQAFIQYVMQFNQPVNTVASLVGQIQSTVVSAERIFEFHDAESQPTDWGRSWCPTPIRGQVKFTEVSFSYRPGTPVIDRVTFTVDAGQVVAIVGPTGAGKTTLVNLLLRFYEPAEGTITIDGVDITEIARSDLRSRIGVVFQDTWLYGSTIADNIAYGRPDATREQIVAAARSVYADGLIRALPEGYDTVVTGEGTRLSAGERQLVTIARAFLVEPAILVLDEATSSVDTRIEMLIQQGMRALRRGRTTFVIAHRLSTVRDADLILVMESGCIVERGTHHELLAVDGAYTGLYATQLSSNFTPE